MDRSEGDMNEEKEDNTKKKNYYWDNPYLDNYPSE